MKSRCSPSVVRGCHDAKRKAAKTVAGLKTLGGRLRKELHMSFNLLFPVAQP